MKGTLTSWKRSVCSLQPNGNICTFYHYNGIVICWLIPKKGQKSHEIRKQWVHPSIVMLCHYMLSLEIRSFGDKHKNLIRPRLSIKRISQGLWWVSQLKHSLKRDSPMPKKSRDQKRIKAASRSHWNLKEVHFLQYTKTFTGVEPTNREDAYWQKGRSRLPYPQKIWVIGSSFTLGFWPVDLALLLKVNIWKHQGHRVKVCSFHFDKI